MCLDDGLVAAQGRRKKKGMAVYHSTNADETIGAVTVRVFRTKAGDTEALILPLDDAENEAHREGAYDLTVFREVFSVPDALYRAQEMVESYPALNQVLIQLHDDASWDDHWGELIRK